MTKSSGRVASLVMAVVFFLSTLVVSVGVIALIIQDQNQRKEEENQLSSQQQTQNNPTENNPNMLQGTKLANFEPVDSVPELQIIDVEEGTGAVVPEGATVVAHYTGAVAKDGTIFQSSHDQPSNEPIEFSLNGVIAGWTKGVPGMKVGGKRRLVIPAAMAYGENPPSGSGIPVNADLVFDIELTAVK